MTEPQKTDHWASLATNLGAEPAPEALKDAASAETPQGDTQGQTAQAAPPPPAFRPAARPAHAPRRPARPAAWDQLAGDLGLAPLPPPPPAASATPPSAGRPKDIVKAELTPEPRARAMDVAREPLPDIVEAEMPLPVWADLEPATEPESFEPQEALDIMDETADEFGDEGSEEAATATDSAGQEAATEERGPRRRRRRRGRGRGREAAPPDEARTANEPGEEPADDEIVLAEGVVSDADDSVREPAPEDRTEGERTERRGRRRRRGRSRDQVRDERTVGEEAAGDDDELDFGGAQDEGAEEEGTVEVEAADEHDFQGEDEHDEHDDEHDEDGDESPRVGFRNIPTWQDAIGVIIAKNLESRSKNPAGPRGPGGRGGRGGGRGRGRRPERR